MENVALSACRCFAEGASAAVRMTSSSARFETSIARSKRLVTFAFMRAKKGLAESSLCFCFASSATLRRMRSYSSVSCSMIASRSGPWGRSGCVDHAHVDREAVVDQPDRLPIGEHEEVALVRIPVEQSARDLDAERGGQSIAHRLEAFGGEIRYLAARREHAAAAIDEDFRGLVE